MSNTPDRNGRHHAPAGVRGSGEFVHELLPAQEPEITLSRKTPAELPEATDCGESGTDLACEECDACEPTDCGNSKDESACKNCDACEIVEEEDLRFFTRFM
jgi:hypothetical protein